MKSNLYNVLNKIYRRTRRFSKKNFKKFTKKVFSIPKEEGKPLRRVFFGRRDTRKYYKQFHNLYKLFNKRWIKFSRRWKHRMLVEDFRIDVVDEEDFEKTLPINVNIFITYYNQF